MIRVYLNRGIVSHGLKFLPGIFLLGLYTLLALRNSSLVGLQSKYDPMIPQDVVAFAAFAVIISLMLIQMSKSYLLYFPSTYLVFDLDRIEFKEALKDNAILPWESIESIDLDIGDNRLLVLNIQKVSGEIIRCYMTHLWLLSISKKWCVYSNFYKLMALASENEKLKSKLNAEQLQFMYIKTGIKIK